MDNMHDSLNDIDKEDDCYTVWMEYINNIDRDILRFKDVLNERKTDDSEYCHGDKKYKNVKNWQVKTPERTLDLHHKSVDTSFVMVRNFIKTAYIDNLRIVNIITGIGRIGGGIVKKELPLWLDASDMKSIITQYKCAPSYAGGEGAMWIYLKK